jgi:ATP adenylyltransferase
MANSSGMADDWTVVGETKGLLAVPSVGALVPGWLLVLPKEHHLSYGTAIEKHPELELELAKLASFWESFYGPLTWFEHGPKEPGSDVGCSVDHAHMHLVPLGPLSLLERGQALSEDITFEPVDGLPCITSALEHDRSYLYLRLPDSSQWLAESNSIPSQYFRRIIAAEQGRPSEWDWKQFPRHELIRDIVAKVS